MTPGRMLGDWICDWTSRTLVDSALAGSQAFASFFSAPVSFPDSGNATTSTTSQKATTTHLVQRPAGISAIRVGLPIGFPPVASYAQTPTPSPAPGPTQSPAPGRTQGRRGFPRC